MEEVLIKYFQGQCSTEELSQVEVFKQNHAREFSLLEQLWRNRTEIHISDYDLQAAWKGIESQIAAKNEPLGKNQTLFTKVSRIAAAFLLLAAVSWAVYQLFSKEEMITITGSATSNPIHLADGSKIWLNEGGLFEYPIRFSGNTRKVYLKGEGFFEVVRDDGSPFTVSTDRSQIRVLGTSFNILETDSTTRVSVSSGSVRVSVKNKNESVELVNGQEALVSLNAVTQRKASPNYASWRTGEFTFDNTPLPKVIAKLKTYYRSGLPNDIPESDCRLTAKISNMNVNEVIELLKEVCDINFS